MFSPYRTAPPERAPHAEAAPYLDLTVEWVLLVACTFSVVMGLRRGNFGVFEGTCGWLALASARAIFAAWRTRSARRAADSLH